MPPVNDELTRSVELLVRGHQLYAGDRSAPNPTPAPEALRQQAQRVVGAAAPAGTRLAVPLTVRLANGLRSTAAADTRLSSVLAAARTDHTAGHHATRTLLDDALRDSMPGADTPLGQREALRRMAARLQHQRRHIRRSYRRALLHAHRIRRVGYLRYDKSATRGSTRDHIADALDHLGITDPAARRNWIRGYETLIARESGGRPFAVASEPATTPGPAQRDGYGLGYARGVTQTIPATFAQYHQPGTATNIYDPVANICASMNYVIHRYGVARNGENLAALVQQADGRRAPKGY